MQDNILYYPAINLPKTDWMIQSILYFDQVGVIVPYEFVDRPNDIFDRHMRPLLDRNIVSMHFPEEYDYLQYSVSNSIYRVIRNRRLFWTRIRDRRLLEVNLTQRIHNRKFKNDLFEYLVEHGLARRDRNSEWYLVEPRIAATMMTYLAVAIGNQINYSPVTDRNAYVIAGNVVPRMTHESQRIRSEILSAIMPHPQTDDFDRLLRFKEHYNDELLNFRKVVESILENAWLVDDKIKRQIFVDRELTRLQERKNELVKRLKENGFGRVLFSTVKGVIADIAISAIIGDQISTVGTVIGTAKGLISNYSYTCCWKRFGICGLIGS